MAPSLLNGLMWENAGLQRCMLGLFCCLGVDYGRGSGSGRARWVKCVCVREGEKKTNRKYEGVLDNEWSNEVTKRERVDLYSLFSLYHHSKMLMSV